MDSLISVIVPVYNVEKYVQKCIQSIINQTFTSLEIICVNDGSTDASLAILQECAAKDSRIIIIDQPNGGLLKVRKTGIARATSPYVTFVDSDDYIENTMYERLFHAAQKENADIAVGAFDIVTESGESIRHIVPKPQTTDGVAALGALIYQDYAETALYPVWNKLYKKELFDAVTIPTEHFNLGEDQYLNLQLLDAAKRVTYVTDICYNYVQRPGSILKSMKPSYIESFFALQALKRSYIDKYAMLAKHRYEILNMYFNNVFDLYGFAYKAHDGESLARFHELLAVEPYFSPSNLPLNAINLLRYAKYLIRRYF